MRLLVESMMGEMEEVELLEITLARLKAENAALRARIKQLELQMADGLPSGG
jgi:BMFP domain-containing protein YqiC